MHEPAIGHLERHFATKMDAGSSQIKSGHDEPDSHPFELQPRQPGVKSVGGGDQRRVRAMLDDAALIHHHPKAERRRLQCGSNPWGTLDAAARHHHALLRCGSMTPNCGACAAAARRTRCSDRPL